LNCWNKGKFLLLSASSSSAYSANESAGAVTITVLLSAQQSQTVTVDYSTSNGTAAAGSDYTSTTGTLSFSPGQASKTFSVPITNDTIPEADETFTVSLSNASIPTNAPDKDGPPAYPMTATVTILDNDASITFLQYALNPGSDNANLFAAEDTSYPLPLIDLSVLVERGGVSGTKPTGTVTFTAIDANNQSTSLGSASIGTDGKATLQGLDSGLLSQPGMTIEAAYSGDTLFAASTKNDGGATGSDLRSDPVVTDNPNVPNNAINLTVVVVCGPGAQRREWLGTARAYYGNSAYIITSVHSVADLGTALANLPAGSVSHLVIGAHGKEYGPQLGEQGVAATRFNADTLDNNANARNAIRAALANNALIDHQSCYSANGPAAQQRVQDLANTLGRRVRASDDIVDGWDQSRGNWITRDPTP
jgi:hypothetical protein